MIETALQLTNRQISGKGIEQILAIGKDLLQKPVELLPDVQSVLEQLKGKYKHDVSHAQQRLMQEHLPCPYKKILYIKIVSPGSDRL
jgi:hypothetical protein